MNHKYMDCPTCCLIAVDVNIICCSIFLSYNESAQRVNYSASLLLALVNTKLKKSGGRSNLELSASRVFHTY